MTAASPLFGYYEYVCSLHACSYFHIKNSDCELRTSFTCREILRFDNHDFVIAKYLDFH